MVSIPVGSECELQGSVAVVAGCACYERGCLFARAVVGVVISLRVRVGVSRRLREPACSVAFTGAGLVCVVSCVWPCVPVRRWALCCTQSAYLLELSRCFMCHVAPLVERCDTCLWLLSAWCKLVVKSGEMLPEFFSIGSGGGEVFPRTLLCSFLRCPVVEVHRLAAVFWWCFSELFVVVLVRVPLPLRLLLCSLKSFAVLPPSFEPFVVWLVAIGLPSRLKCIAWLPYVLVRFSKTVGCCPSEVHSQDCSGLVYAGCCATSGLRYAAVVLAVAFWWVFPGWHLGGSGGSSPKTSCVAFTVCCVLSVGRLFGLRSSDGPQNGS
ncbi:hypothetical protein Taro_002650 [Colocasia esculenta]|uniref:Uncharacterized protein n=1 Tax=Colocasia esculenta TaxID=4460 RepID=A0A843TER7_COLES|nr:hypothetical protein [Colocasia esculenta]